MDIAKKGRCVVFSRDELEALYLVFSSYCLMALMTGTGYNHMDLLTWAQERRDELSVLFESTL